MDRAAKPQAAAATETDEIGVEVKEREATMKEPMLVTITNLLGNIRTCMETYFSVIMRLIDVTSMKGLLKN